MPKKSRKGIGGRPLLLTPELHNRIVELVREGHYQNVVARACGIDEKSIRNWRRRGLDGEQPYAAFLAAVDRAEAEGEIALQQMAIDLAKRDIRTWTGPMTVLERRFPERWGRRDAVVVSHRVERELSRGLDRLKEQLPTDVYAVVLEAFAGDAGTETPPADPVH